MLRRVFTLGSILSLLICLASAGLLVRSAMIGDRWDWTISSHVPAGDLGTLWTVLSGRGGLGVARSTVLARPRAPFPAARWFQAHHRTDAAGYPVWAPSKGTIVNWQGPGCQLLRIRYTDTKPATQWAVNEQAIVVPLWGLMILAAILPVGRFVVAVRQTRRRRGGRCVCCGYDLRAASDRCSECGTPVPSRQQPTA